MDKKKYNVFHMDDESLREHIGHELVVNDVWSYQENRETGLEIHCRTCDVDPYVSDCGPLFEMAYHKDHPCRV